jgi:hypothetical protein
MSNFANSIELLVTHEIASAISESDAQALARTIEVLIRCAAVVCVCGVGRSEETLNDLLESAAQQLFEEASRISLGAEKLHARNGGGA